MYKFERPLEKGRIISRPNRFIMNVEKDGAVFVCHCPSTGKIGNVVFDNVPCLLSKSSDEKRKTPYTVEAISIDNEKSWIGINQNAVNRYVEYFFKNGFLDGIAKNGHMILREQKIGNSKLDFRIENTYIEVKMPLIDLFTIASLEDLKDCKTTSFERFVRHITDLSTNVVVAPPALMALPLVEGYARCNCNAEVGSAKVSAHTATTLSGALLTCFVFDTPTFRLPKFTERNEAIVRAVCKAVEAGVKMWQVNMTIDQSGVNLLRYFDITYMFLES